MGHALHHHVPVHAGDLRRQPLHQPDHPAAERCLHPRAGRRHAPAAQITGILALEQGLFTAQATDTLAGSLSAAGAAGGSANLAAVNYYPGKALSTGLCADVNLVKVPILRGLAARAPYFHNGAANLTQLVNFYNARFQMNLTTAQMTDLVNFLNAL